MSVALATIAGVLAGAHTSTWGMYKDAVHEGFTVPKYLRSMLISGMIAPALVLLAGMPAAGIGNLIVLFGVTYVMERALVEFWKTFLREEDQSKYFIPMQFAVRGRVVHNRRTRLIAGACVAAVAILLVALVIGLQSFAMPASGAPLPWWIFLLAGSIGGWFSAVGGAWKDAPHEGFETFKFFRSPVLAALFALLASQFSEQVLWTSMAGLGFTIATLETYKTFCFPNKPRGKFAGKPVLYPVMLHRRNWFVPLYVIIWLLLLAGFIAG
ncbi:MAG TPA: hypothetical protein VMN60_06110 [Longimicrobiales bacterium]|nr:hypothetical protein [Longimicrobiales bacterium]